MGVVDGDIIGKISMGGEGDSCGLGGEEKQRMEGKTTKEGS